MDDAMVLLQTARRLASAAFRRESNCLSDDSFSPSSIPLPPSNSNQNSNMRTQSASQQQFEPEPATQLLAHVKLLLRRRAAAHAALEAGLHSESVRHFSKIIDSRCGVPVPFAAACLVGRAAANRAAGRLADAISDCNRALALDPSSIPALRTRAALFEALHALPDCLYDLDHLKLLYDSILRDGKLPGPPWRWPNQDVRLREIPMSLRALTSRIQELRGRIASGEGSNLDYYALLGVRHGCTRSELERAHLLLSLKYKPEKAIGFADRLEIVDEYRDLDAVRDQAKMSASILYRMLQKGYLCILAVISAEEEAEKRRAMEAVQAALTNSKVENPVMIAKERNCGVIETTKEKSVVSNVVTTAVTSVPPVHQGVFCRDLAVVGSLLSRAIPVKYEALSC
jgi:tetratricopeptide (TPR) repeat protein